MSGKVGRRPGDHPPGTMIPGWDAPESVGALFTTRAGGVSGGRWSGPDGEGGLNLGSNCGDEPQHVAQNRARLAANLAMPVSWLAQVHGARVIDIGETSVLAASGEGAIEETADAQVTTMPGIALGVLVADCLPVMLADRGGSIVGVAHAGWRGLAAGVLENTVGEMLRLRRDADLVAWLGPCIGAAAFEVGDDVLQAFVRDAPGAAAHFRPGSKAGKWWADLPALAADRLRRAGVSSVAASGACTVVDRDRFWSYRRDAVCGRMAGLVWLKR